MISGSVSGNTTPGNGDISQVFLDCDSDFYQKPSIWVCGMKGSGKHKFINALSGYGITGPKYTKPLFIGEITPPCDCFHINKLLIVDEEEHSMFIMPGGELPTFDIYGALWLTEEEACFKSKDEIEKFTNFKKHVQLLQEKHGHIIKICVVITKYGEGKVVHDSRLLPSRKNQTFTTTFGSININSTNKFGSFNSNIPIERAQAAGSIVLCFNSFNKIARFAGDNEKRDMINDYVDISFRDLAVTKAENVPLVTSLLKKYMIALSKGQEISFKFWKALPHKTVMSILQFDYNFLQQPFSAEIYMRAINDIGTEYFSVCTSPSTVFDEISYSTTNEKYRLRILYLLGFSNSQKYWYMYLNANNRSENMAPREIQEIEEEYKLHPSRLSSKKFIARIIEYRNFAYGKEDDLYVEGLISLYLAGKIGSLLDPL